MLQRFSTHVLGIILLTSKMIHYTSREIAARLRIANNKNSRLPMVAVFSILFSSICAAAPDTIYFDISRQNAGEALPVLGQQADITVIYPFDEVKNHQTNPLKGNYTLHDAVTALLRGSGLSARFNGNHHLIITISRDEENKSMSSNKPNPQKTLLASILGALFATSGQQSLAQNRPMENIGLEEIVVTAQKREEKYLDVPVAVSTLSGELLEMTKTREFEDLVGLSPSVTFDRGLSSNNSGIQVRGIGSTTLGIGVEPTVSTVIDGVTMGSTTQFLTDLSDIERIEVLRGPQGTLFGKNASAGLINVITKRPSHEFEAAITGSTTSDDGWGLSAQVSGPLTDNVRGRLSAFSKEYDGYFTNITNGESLNGYDREGVRGKLEIDLTDSANLLLIADYSKQENNCCARSLAVLGTAPQDLYDWRDLNVNSENTELTANTPTVSDTETSGLSGELTIDFDNFVFTSITAYRQMTLDTQQDVDGYGYTVAMPGRSAFISNGTSDGNSPDGEQEFKQFSQEIRVTTTAWDNFDVTAGAFYWDQEITRYFEREVLFCPGTTSTDPSLTCTEAGGTPRTAFGYMDAGLDIKNWAVFGQANWHIAEDWTASLGLRYTKDDIGYNFIRATETPGPATRPSYPVDGIPLTNSTKEDNVSGKLSVQWDATENTMIYASYGEGYKAPAFDVIFGLNSLDRSNPVPAETSKAWEIGTKSEFFDNRLRLGVTAFHTKFNGLQGTGTQPDEVGFFLTSAGTAITKGVEIDFAAKPTANLLLSGGIAWIDAYFDEYRNGQCYIAQTEAEGCVGGIQDLSGKDIPNSPKVKYTLQARYDFNLDSLPFNAYVSGNYRWQDKSVGDVNQDARVDRDSYGLLGLNFGLESNDGRWSVEAFVKNALDDFYEERRMLSPSNPRVVYHVLNREAYRYAGVEFTYHLGAY